MRKRLKVNDNFFAKPTLTNSYWAGFIAADGCIYSHKSNKINTLEIHLAFKDYWHLHEFANTANFEGKIKYKKASHSYSLKITSEKICSDLKKNFNIIPKKSLKLEPPKNISKQQALAFIKGYIDGDGSIFRTITEYNSYITFSVLGTKNVVSWIKIQLSNKFKLKLKNNIYCNGKVSQFKIVGKSAKRILNVLDNKIKTPRLDRKWDIIYG